MRWFRAVILMVYLLIAAFMDIKGKIVSVKLAALAAAVGTIFQFLQPQMGIAEWMSGLLPAVVLILMAWLTKQAVGFGDGCVLGVIGLYIGFWGSIGTLMMGLLLSCPISLFLLICKKADRKHTIPFVPFLAMGCGAWLLMQNIGG